MLEKKIENREGRFGSKNRLTKFVNNISLRNENNYIGGGKIEERLGEHNLKIKLEIWEASNSIFNPVTIHSR